MFCFLRLMFGLPLRLFRSRRDLLLENLILRQQLSVLKRRNRRPRLSAIDKLFWVAVQRLWFRWRNSLIVVTPEIDVRWHRAGFRFYWSFISRRRSPGGRKRISNELRDLIFKMVAENPTWGAPRIHGELLALGFDISERTVSHWVSLPRTRFVFQHLMLRLPATRLQKYDCRLLLAAVDSA